MLNDKQRNKYFDYLLIQYFRLAGNLKYDINKINSSKVIIQPHLGLGDTIICNGLINKLSESFDVIYLPIKDRYAEMIKYLFKDNNKLNFFEVSYSNSTYDVLSFGNKNKVPILRIGFEKQKNNPFNTWFYDQTGIDYKISYEMFRLPKNEKQSIELYNHLLEYYKIENEDYNLVHCESYNKNFDLKEINNFKNIFVSKESDLFKNMFLYEKVIKNAKEIHCINSSFFHLVDRLPTNARLYYHNVRHSNFYMSEKWNLVKY